MAEIVVGAFGSTRVTRARICNHLGLLRVMFKVALRWRLVQRTPVDQVEAPRVEQREMNVLSEVEIARLLAAYLELEREAEGSADAVWWRLTRRLVQVALATALRRGELLALRWHDVELLDGRLQVRQAYVRGEFQAPKSRSSRRTLDLGPRAVAVLGEAYEESRYRPRSASCSATRRSAHRSIPPGWHASTCAQRWRGPRSPSRSVPGTTFATRRSRTRPPPVTRTRMCS